MKLTKTAAGQRLELSYEDWKVIGKQTKWILEAVLDRDASKHPDSDIDAVATTCGTAFLKFASDQIQISKEEWLQIGSREGWTKKIAAEWDDDYYGDDVVDVDLGDVDIEDVLQEMEDEEQERMLFTDNVDEEFNYIAQCEEAMSILSPLMKQIADGEYIDPDSVLNELIDAVGPLVGDNLDLSDRLGTVQMFLAAPDRPEDEDLKQGIRTIMGMTRLPIENETDEPRLASEKPPLGFYQSSDLWPNILKDR